MIKPYHIYLSAILLFVSRSVFAERTYPIDPSNTPQESLNTLLSCGKYTRLQDYFGIPGAGCLYRGGKNNQLGNAEIFLVPKSGFITTPYKEDPEEEERINTQGINYILKNYNIYLTLVGKKFINRTHGDTEYYPDYPYEQFTFENTNGYWEAITWRKISSKTDLDWDYYWRESYIKYKNQNSETKNKHAQCLSTLKSFISTSEFPLHGVKAENLKFYIYRDYSGKMIGFHAYFLMKDGYEGNDFDRKKILLKWAQGKFI